MIIESFLPLLPETHATYVRPSPAGCDLAVETWAEKQSQPRRARWQEKRPSSTRDVDRQSVDGVESGSELPYRFRPRRVGFGTLRDLASERRTSDTHLSSRELPRE